MQSLQDDAVDIHIACCKLLVQVDVVVLAEIHSDVHGKAGEASFKSSFESILLVLLTSTMLDRNHSSFCQSSLIQLIKSSILDFNE